MDNNKIQLFQVAAQELFSYFSQLYLTGGVLVV